MTTCLAAKLIEKVFQPRAGIEQAFKVGLPSSQNRLPVSQIGQIIFFTISQCLDVMMEIKKHRFKYYPEITSELSQYLAIHTDYEATKKLGEQVDDLVEKQKKSAKEAQAAVNTANAANNLYDNKTKSTLSDFEKRLLILEKKAGIK